MGPLIQKIYNKPRPEAPDVHLFRIVGYSLQPGHELGTPDVHLAIAKYPFFNTASHEVNQIVNDEKEQGSLFPGAPKHEKKDSCEESMDQCVDSYA